MKPIPATPEELKNCKLVTYMEVHPAILKGVGHRGACFYRKVTLTLSDGSTVPWVIESPKKRDLSARIEREEKAIAAKAMKYDERGTVSTTYSMF